MTTFENFNLSESMIKSIKNKGFKEPTDIQKQVIPILLNEEVNIVGQAQTGTGKTASFGIPIIEKIDENLKCVQALILSPTRELSLQITKELVSLKNKNIRISTIYGGVPIQKQVRYLNSHIIVGTPGRVLDFLRRGELDLRNLKYFVLDEADEMLNMGFIDDVREILRYTNKNKKILLFSATLPKKILDLAKEELKEYILCKVKKEKETAENIEQYYCKLKNYEKIKKLTNIIDKDFYGIVFCATKKDTKELAKNLFKLGFKADTLHGDLSQKKREKVLDKFKKKKINILVATDVASRGLDINNLTHVINYSLPQDVESYIHRIGRTGRIGKKGIAITFIHPKEIKKLKLFEKRIKSNIKRFI